MSDNEIKLNPKYEPLWTADYDIAIVLGGRGSGKSYGVNTYLTDLTTRDDHGILFTRFTMTSAETSIIPEFNQKIELLGLLDQFDITKKDISSKFNDSFIMFRGIKASSGNQTAKLKSIPGLTTFVVDEAEEFTSEEDFDTIHYSIRKKGIKNRVIIVLNPAYKTHWIYKRFFKPHNLPEEFSGQVGRVLYIHTTYEDNINNLSSEYLNEIETLKKTNPKKYKHKIRGHWADEAENALWKQLTMIDPFRVFNLPDLRRIVVGVDPSVENTGTQDECGIVACGVDFQSPAHFYLIDDKSGVLTTKEWARIAVSTYKNNEADRIVPEVNNGGQLVVDVIKNVDINIPCTPVRASRGKITRAESIAGLAEEGRIHHVGHFGELEEQLTTYDGTGESPGRLDAYVWAMTELSQNCAPDFIVM